MSAAFGVRLTDCGSDRVSVLARIRPLVQRPPAEVKAAAVRGEQMVVVLDVCRSSAEELAAELRRLGAVAEVFVSDPCPSNGDG
jgi:hypothetical protein